MSLKPIILREQAAEDVQIAIDYYLGEGSTRAARNFIDALERGFVQLARHPSSGSPRYALELNLPELRCWPIKRYPWLIFFVERERTVGVWRVLHAARDIPESLR